MLSQYDFKVFCFILKKTTTDGGGVNWQIYEDGSRETWLRGGERYVPYDWGVLSQPKSFFLNGNRKVSIERNFLAPNIDSPITATITIWKSSTISHRYNYPEILSTSLVNSKKNVPVIRSKKWMEQKGNDLLVQNLARKLDSGWLSHTQSTPEHAPVRSPSLSHVSREPSSYEEPCQ